MFYWPHLPIATGRPQDVQWGAHGEEGEGLPQHNKVHLWRGGPTEILSGNWTTSGFIFYRVFLFVGRLCYFIPQKSLIIYLLVVTLLGKGETPLDTGFE